MPSLIECPSCRRQLQVPDELVGAKVQCPACGMMFLTMAGSPAGPPSFPRPAEAPTSLPAEVPSVAPLQPPDVRVQSKLIAPAVGLAIAAILGLLVCLVELVIVLAVNPNNLPKPGMFPEDFWKDVVAGFFSPLSIVMRVAFSILNVLTLVAAVQMVRRKTWGFALAGCILALINLNDCCCWVLNAAMAIWGLIVLLQPDVRAAFEAP